LAYNVRDLAPETGEPRRDPVADPVQTPLALSDVRVLDLSGEPGWYCGKLLAELGADVIKVEPPGGDPGRRIGPFYHGEVDPQKSLYFFAHNTSKRSVTLNVVTADGRSLFRRLVATSDVVIETFPPGFLESLGLGYEALTQVRPGIIVASITGFGQSGPHSHYKAPDIVAVAMSGMMYLAGFPEDPPNRPYGNQSTTAPPSRPPPVSSPPSYIATAPARASGWRCPCRRLSP